MQQSNLFHSVIAKVVIAEGKKRILKNNEV